MLSKITDKFKFMGKHYRMERFMIFFSILAILMLTTAGFGLKSKINKDRQMISDDAIYTKQFVTSRTEVTGNVVDVYTNNDKTKAFLLLKFDNLGAISTNAENYQMFMKAADVSQNPQKFTAPAASIYNFGSTGYMGIYFVKKDGFDKQIMTLTFRCNAEIVEIKEKSEVEEVVKDKSFEKYDQFVVNFNPGGAKATIMECLNSDTTPTYSDLYNQSVVVTEETAIREELDTLLDKLRVDLNAIAEYQERLVAQWGVVIPEVPISIRGDKVTGTKLDGDLTLHTDYVMARGFDFDWRNGSIKEGYLDKLMSDKHNSYEAFFADKNRETNDDVFRTKEIKWQLIDGMYLEDLNIGGSGGSRDRYTRINNDIQRLLQSWDTYKSDKARYQVTKLRELLMLELDLRSIDRITTVNTSEKVLICY